MYCVHDMILPFGKYRGKFLVDIYNEEHYSYILWLSCRLVSNKNSEGSISILEHIIDKLLKNRIYYNSKGTYGYFCGCNIFGGHHKLCLGSLLKYVKNIDNEFFKNNILKNKIIRMVKSYGMEYPPDYADPILKKYWPRIYYLYVLYPNIRKLACEAIYVSNMCWVCFSTYPYKNTMICNGCYKRNKLV